MVHGFGLLRRGGLLGALACLAAVGLAIPTTAAAKVTKLTSCQDITSPGRYRLAANVTGSCFQITANNVRLALDRHTITSVGGAGIGINVVGIDDRIVGPGTISNFTQGAGIWLQGGNGFPGEGSTVRRVTVTGNGDGIGLSSRGNVVLDSVATDNKRFGIEVDFDSFYGTIIGNFAHNNGQFDLYDGNPNCGNNVWLANDFGTANQSCIH